MPRTDSAGGGPRIGLALGGGGARGIAHIPVLEALDELGVRPCCIAGTSIGAIMGALYAAGNRGRDIKALVDRYTIHRGESLKDLFRRKQYLLKWFEALVPEWSTGGLIRSDRLLSLLCDAIDAERFEDLAVPLRVVAADYWTSEQVVFDSGPLLPALRASMAVPGVFRPVEHGGRVLIDGGVVNQLPYDLLPPGCDVVLAVNVGGPRRRGKRAVPRAAECMIAAYDILQDAQVAEKVRRAPPTIYLRSATPNIQVFQFDRAESIYRHARRLGAKAKEQLAPLLARD